MKRVLVQVQEEFYETWIRISSFIYSVMQVLRTGMCLYYELYTRVQSSE